MSGLAGDLLPPATWSDQGPMTWDEAIARIRGARVGPVAAVRPDGSPKRHTRISARPMARSQRDHAM